MVLATNLGFPRLGAQRELKWVIERYWSGKSSQAEVEKTARELRQRHWKFQSDLDLDHIPSNDFSLYYHVLDMSVMLGAVPSRFRESGMALASRRETVTAPGDPHFIAPASPIITGIISGAATECRISQEQHP